jgi:hypothetical protein
MTPPVLAQALVTAAAPPSDYESVAGDLHEEYVRLLRVAGARAANRWYWSQALRSIPSLLSYSRAQRSITGSLAVAAIALGVLLAMLFAKDLIDQDIGVQYRGGHCPAWLYFSVDWLDAAVFGAILALIVRSGGVRLALWSSLLLVAVIAVPTLLGFSSRLPLYAWVLIVGAIPSMSIGAGLYQVLRRRQQD